MHEMGIAMQVMEIAIDSIPEEMGDARVERVNLKVGRLAAVVPDSLRFCFDIITKDTRISGAELNIEEVPVVAKCNDCHEEFTIDGPAFSCTECGGGSIEIISGRELDIASIEIAEDEDSSITGE